jgi:cytochrome c-type biogenesis protein CcmE
MNAPRPALTRRRRRLYLLGAAAVVLALAATLILNSFKDSLVFFYSPSDIATRADIPRDRLIRIGGLVEKGSIIRAGSEIRFTVTDTAHNLRVVYRGILPDLFREGQGVVAQGSLKAGGGETVFEAREVLAKHDETYMPREVADAIKKSGQWKPDEAGTK